MKTLAKRTLNLKASLYSLSLVGLGRRQMLQISTANSVLHFQMLSYSPDSTFQLWGSGHPHVYDHIFTHSFSDCLLFLLHPAPQNANAVTGTQSTCGIVSWVLSRTLGHHWCAGVCAITMALILDIWAKKFSLVCLQQAQTCLWFLCRHTPKWHPDHCWNGHSWT